MKIALITGASQGIGSAIADKLNDKKILENVNEYWKLKDPTPNTLKNELLIEFNSRVYYANNNFSVNGSPTWTVGFFSSIFSSKLADAILAP